MLPELSLASLFAITAAILIGAAIAFTLGMYIGALGKNSIPNHKDGMTHSSNPSPRLDDHYIEPPPEYSGEIPKQPS
ncbi:hypothetical protein BDQ17DRAFT_1364607 [Cyathus striatus]|nr:hypothetical protein BDQ17DRAFT_1364607 [Cyathus striatus]